MVADAWSVCVLGLRCREHLEALIDASSPSRVPILAKQGQIKTYITPSTTVWGSPYSTVFISQSAPQLREMLRHSWGSGVND